MAGVLQILPCLCIFPECSNSRTVLVEGAPLPRNICNPEDLPKSSFLFLRSRWKKLEFYFKELSTYNSHLNRFNYDIVSNFTNHMEEARDKSTLEKLVGKKTFLYSGNKLCKFSLHETI